MISLQRLSFLLSSSRIIISIAAKNYVPTAKDLPYTVAGLDSKCPYEHENRIMKKKDSSREECYELCKDHPDCIAFTFSDHADDCMLCKSASNLESHKGYITYKLNFKLAFELSKCPEDNTRIFKESKSFDECEERCYNQPTCEYFSHNESSEDCLGCSSSALPLDTKNAIGFKTFELKDLKDFPYKLTALDEKCPSKGRLLKTSTKTREECYELCNDTSGCGYFTYGEGDKLRQSEKDMCMLCNKSASLEKHHGAIVYEIITTKNEAATKVHNIAKGKVATQSSTCHGGPAARAVDGNNSGVWGHKSVSHTCKNAMNTWSVTLGLSVITKIVIWNRTDCCAERIKGAKLEILNGDDLVASRNIDSTTRSYTFDFEDVVGSVVKVSRANEYLSLAEVEVFGVIQPAQPIVLPQPVTKCTFVLHPHMDSGGNDIGQYTGGVDNYKKICLANPKCTCFNSNGWVKYVTKPKTQWRKWTNDKSLGLYVKTCAKQLIREKCSFKPKYIKKWPHCKNILCTPHAVTKASMEEMCRSYSDCTGFSFSTGSSTGSGCLKKCGGEEFGGFGATTHDYWAKDCIISS